MRDDFSQTVAANLRAARAKTGKRQEDVKEETGISVNSIGNWESGANLPRVDSLVKVADCYGCSLDSLVGRADR